MAKTRAQRLLFNKKRCFARVFVFDGRQNSNETLFFLEKEAFRSSLCVCRETKLERNACFLIKITVSLEFCVVDDHKWWTGRVLASPFSLSLTRKREISPSPVALHYVVLEHTFREHLLFAMKISKNPKTFRLPLTLFVVLPHETPDFLASKK